MQCPLLLQVIITYEIECTSIFLLNWVVYGILQFIIEHEFQTKLCTITTYCLLSVELFSLPCWDRAQACKICFRGLGFGQLHSWYRVQYRDMQISEMKGMDPCSDVVQVFCMGLWDTGHVNRMMVLLSRVSHLASSVSVSQYKYNPTGRCYVICYMAFWITFKERLSLLC